MALKETLNGFSQIKKHAAKSAMKRKHSHILLKNLLKMGNVIWAISLKCKIVYDDTVYN